MVYQVVFSKWVIGEWDNRLSGGHFHWWMGKSIKWGSLVNEGQSLNESLVNEAYWLNELLVNGGIGQMSPRWMGHWPNESSMNGGIGGVIGEWGYWLNKSLVNGSHWMNESLVNGNIGWMITFLLQLKLTIRWGGVGVLCFQMFCTVCGELGIGGCFQIQI